LKEKKKQVEKIIEAPEKQRKIDKLEKENDRLRGWSILGIKKTIIFNFLTLAGKVTN